MLNSSVLTTASTSPTPSRLRWQDLFILEGSGLRTTFAAIVPLVLGQISGNPEIGMLAAVGGLQVAFADFDGAKARTLLWATLSSAAMALCGAFVSQSSPAVCISVMFIVAFGLAMLGTFGAVLGNLGFVLTITYAFAQSVPVSWLRGIEYFWTFVLGGVWASLLTLLLWKLRRSLGDLTVGLSQVFPVASLSGTTSSEGGMVRFSVFKHALRTAIAMAVAVAICQKWHPPHGYWIALTVMVILKPDYHSTKGRLVQRWVGTISGGLLAMIPAAYIHSTFGLDALLVLFGVLAFSQLPRNYGIYVLFLTPFVVLITTIASPADAQVAVARIAETILGGTLAFSVAFFLRRSSWNLKSFQS